MKVSVVIPTLNRRESLLQTIDYAEKSILKPLEIIVIDQTIDPCEAKKVKECCNKSSLNVLYYHLATPSSTKSRNIGLEKAKGDIIVFMDDDVDVKPNTFQIICDIFKDEKFSLVAGINENERVAHSWKGYLFCKSSIKKRHIGHVTKAIYGRYPNTTQEMVDTEWAMGFFFAIRKSHLLQMGGLKFDERMEHYAYAEDLDFTYSYCRQAKQKGFICGVSPDLLVRHNVSKEYRVPSRRVTFIKTIHRIYLSNKHFHSTTSLLSVYWSDFGDMIQRMLRRESIRDNITAFVFSIKYLDDIKQGHFHYELFI